MTHTPIADPMAGAFLERSHPEYGNPDPETDGTAAPGEAEAQAARLLGLANQIRAWQDAQRPKISDEGMVKRYPGLGSSKTYRRLRDGDFEGLVVANHLAKLNGVWNAIELAAAHGHAAEEIYEDITPAMDSGLAIAGAIPQTGQTRLVVIEGPTGSGKTSALRLAAKRYAGNVAMVEATEGWNSLNAALGDILRAVAPHAEEVPSGNAERLKTLVAALRARRLTILIDEGHHMTASTLNVLKTLINQTPAVIIIAGIDTLWRKLTNRSWEEAKQLLLNRLYERVRLGPPGESDARRFMERRLGGKLEKGWEASLHHAVAAAAHGGYWAFLRRLCDRLADSGETVDAAAIALAARSIAAGLETQGKR
jgi:hypothetical protein